MNQASIPQVWNRLFIPMTDAALTAVTVAEALRRLLEAAGYTTYDPFPGGTGTPVGMTDLIKAFVAPPQDDWITVLGNIPDGVLLDLHGELSAPVVAGWLNSEGGGFALFSSGERQTEPDAFAPYLRASVSLEALAQAFAGKLSVEVIESDQPPVVALGTDSLPPEIAQLAEDQGADPQQASKLFEKMSGKLFNRLSKQSGATKAEQEQAKAMFMGGGGQDAWNSLHGQRVRAIISVLNLPDNWRTPAQDKLRDAYQVFRLRKRAPRMMLMPGDQEAMDAVPNALDYEPVYLGRK